MASSYEVTCPVCGAKPGRTCKTHGIPCKPHEMRRHKANDAAAAHADDARDAARDNRKIHDKE